MTVIVNELEVVVASTEPGAQRGGGGAGEAASAPPALTPRDLAEQLERRDRTELRLLAH
ncbi:MAG: hypothetical protein ABW277_15065 [Longimicrobiaceae bacterium]